MAVIHRVHAVGPPSGDSDVAEGAVLALKICIDERLSRETMKREVEIFETLQQAKPAPPCPRLYDLVMEGDHPIGMVMEWCPTDMERWWEEMHVLPDAMEPLCGALADVCRRIAEYHAFMASQGMRAVHADIKPRNAVLANDGRWLLIDFGAAKRRPLEMTTWEATRVILGTENFIAPEMLFNARKLFPEAMDTWSVGVTFFTLLRVRSYLLRGAEMPLDGTHNIQFRCHRMSAVTDLRERKPDAFAGKSLDVNEFPSPVRLPDEDRWAVSEALEGVFGQPDPPREKKLEEVILQLLDKALAIDPSQRFTRAEHMSQAFDRVVRRYWELEGSVPPAGLDRAAVESQPAATAASGPAAEPATPEQPNSGAAVAPEPTGPESPDPVPQHQEPTKMPPEAENAPDGEENGPARFALAGHGEERTVIARPAPAPQASGPPDQASEPIADAADAASSAERASGPMAPSPAAAEPAPIDERVLRLLEGIQHQLQAQRRPPAEGKSVGVPVWLLVLTVGLLLLFQAVQFGLLAALLLYGWQGPVASGPLGTQSELVAAQSEMGAAQTDQAAEEPPPAKDETAAGANPLLSEVAEDPGSAHQEEDVGEEAIGEEDVGEEGVRGEDVRGEDVRGEDVRGEDVRGEDVRGEDVGGEDAAPAVAAEEERRGGSSQPAPVEASSEEPASVAAAPAASQPEASGSNQAAARSDAESQQSAAAAQEQAPEADETTASDVQTTFASITVVGASGYLMGPSGRSPLGEVPAGSYEVFAEPKAGEGYLTLGVHGVEAGDNLIFRCGFGSCRASR